MKQLSILIFMIGVVYAKGMGNLEFGGYIENKTSLIISENETISDIATVRLEGVWDFGKSGGIETNLIVTGSLQPIDIANGFKKGSLMEAVFGELFPDPQTIISAITQGQDTTTQQNVADFDLSSIEKFLPYLPYSSFYPNNTLNLDRALLKVFFSWCDFYIGKQMIAWGTGYAFNPTDIWNRKNPTDADAPKTGLNAIRMEIPFGAVTGLSLVVSPGRDINHSSAGFRVKGNLGRYDFSVSGMSIMNADKVLFNIPRKLIAGVDIAGEIADIGIWFEAAAINPLYRSGTYDDFDSLYGQIDGGLDYTFTNGLYIMAEYYYNGLGKKDYKKYGTSDVFNLLSGEMGGFAQHYIMAGMRKDIFDTFVLSLFSLGNLNDYSAMALPSIEYDFNDTITMKLLGQIGVGNKTRTEYGSYHPVLSFLCTGYF